MLVISSLVFVAGLTVPVRSSAQEMDGEACSEGRVSEIIIDNGDVFVAGPDTPKAVELAYGAVNLLHIRTSPSFLRKELLFAEGDCYDPFLLGESQRLLDAYSFLAEVRVETVGEDSDGKTVRVTTRDHWSTQVDLGVTYDAGLKLEKFQATEKNFLGHGVNAEATHRARREVRDRSLTLSTPRLFGRTDAGFGVGTSRQGFYYWQGIGYSFLGETSQLSGSQRSSRGVEFFSYTTGGSEPYSHLLIPYVRERFEIAVGRRFGEPGRSTILGFSLQRDVRRDHQTPEFILGEDFDQSVTTLDDLPASVQRQVVGRGATRVAMHLGTRRYQYVEYTGLDAVKDVQMVGAGFFAGISLGRSLGLLVPDDVQEAGDTYGRVHASFGLPLGSSLLHGGTTVEAAYSDGATRDIIAGAELVAYGRAGWLPSQTLFFRASTGGGWRTTIPMQLSLGGRDGVRSLRDDVLPGGKRILFVLEDRFVLDRLDLGVGDVGFTLFADAGRTWAGDAPFGVDSGWYGSFGFGLRLGIPSGTRNIWRPDVVFPLGREGSPVFRITFELNRFRSGFGTPRLDRSRSFTRGPEHY